MKEKLWSVAMFTLCIVFPVMLAGAALFGVHGCAHVAAIATACKAVPADVDTALADLQSDGWQAALQALAVAKGLCIARAAVQEVIAGLTGAAELALPDGTPTSAEIVSRGKAWLTANPQ